ncbi:MAG: hypothetical protein COA97_11580 [Flavobacteriales bacterium]|nr:MAG: hypothetical protein COA97_11580 [Flavobacteriales bacterium]
MKFFLIILTFLTFLTSNAQVTIWSEDFDGNGGSGSNWGALNQNIGGQGANANLWYISCQENGETVGNCGLGCGTNQTLHLGSTTLGDIGAAYDVGCMPGCLVCDFFPAFCSNTTTNKRSQSQNINTIGQTTLTLNFNYIERGEGVNDDAIVEYSIDGGATWLTLINTAKTPLVCNPQGQWTAFSIVLPVTTENITNLRIAYRWQNNTDAVGNDPTFAVNDITITKPSVLPITLLSFKATIKNDNNILLEWVTESEINNNFFIIERSKNAIDFSTIITIDGAGNSNTSIYYSETDVNIPKNSNLYYRLKQIDFDGRFSYSDIISIQSNTPNYNIIYVNHSLSITSNNDRAKIEIYNIIGENVYSNNVNNSKHINTSSFNAGIYIVKIGTSDNFIVRKIKF